MKCPDEISEPLLEILKFGLLNIRYYGGKGDSERCSIEANHLHNIPGMLRLYSPEMLDYYLDGEQPEFVKNSGNVNLGPFESSWERLRSFRSHQK